MDDIHPELTVQFPEHRREFISLLQANYQYIPCFRTCQIFSGKLLFVRRLESPDALCRVLVIGILVSSSPWVLFCVPFPENTIRVSLDCFVCVRHGKPFFQPRDMSGGNFHHRFRPILHSQSNDIALKFQLAKILFYSQNSKQNFHLTRKNERQIF